MEQCHLTLDKINQAVGQRHGGAEKLKMLLINGGVLEKLVDQLTRLGTLYNSNSTSISDINCSKKTFSCIGNNVAVSYTGRNRLPEAIKGQD